MGGRLPLVVLAFLFVWAAAPGRSPTFVEESLLTPFTRCLGLARSLFRGGEAELPGPSTAEQAGWLALQDFETRVTRPPGEAGGVMADVLARRGPQRLRDLLLLSVPFAPGRVEVGDPCLVGGVLVGFVDEGPTRRPSRSLLGRLGLGAGALLPENAWVRLLHSTSAPWPEPLRLEVRLGEDPSGPPDSGGIKAVVGPVREDDSYPLRLLHPAALERPRPGLHAFAWQGVGPLSRISGGTRYRIGRIAVSPERPDLCFVQPVLDPDAIHRVYVQSRLPGQADLDPRRRGPLGRGDLISSAVTPLPDADFGGATLLLQAGSLAGVRNGAAVVRGWTLTGVITAVGPWHSRAATPEDPSFRLRVLVARPPGPGAEEIVALMRGEVRASVRGVKGLLWFPDRDAGPLLPGDRIWSAPAGLDLPKGLFLGLVGQTGRSGPVQGFALRRSSVEPGRPDRVGVFRFLERTSEGNVP